MNVGLSFAWCLVVVGCLMGGHTAAAQDCEVCVGFIGKFINKLTAAEKTDTAVIEQKFREACSTAKSRENRFCYYVGGLEESATGILGEISKPLSWGMPAAKVCEKLQKKDGQICELRYEKQIDLNTVDLKKLKVRDLKKILLDWDEQCNDCLEKGDYIRFIEGLKPKYVNQEL